MADPQLREEDRIVLDISHLEIEDGEPVDNIFSEKQMRLLTESLYASWRNPDGSTPVFAAFANVGLFYAVNQAPVVPDVMVSLDIVARPDPSDKSTLSYFCWEHGKPPDIVIEIVSNREGGEDSTKLEHYARIGVAYYAIYDPDLKLSKRPLRLFSRHANTYVPFVDPSWLPELGLGLCLWKGCYEGTEGTWLRWVNDRREMLATGAEALAAAQTEAAAAQAEAAAAHARAAHAEAEAEALRQQLRQLQG